MDVGSLISDLLGLPNLADLVNDIKGESLGWIGDFRDWASGLYVALFALQFFWIGVHLFVRGPFAITQRPTLHYFGAPAQFLYFCIAGVIGALLVDSSIYVDPVDGIELYNHGTTYGGWVPWLFGLFDEAGSRLGCGGTVSTSLTLVGNPCDPNTTMWVAMQLSTLLMLGAETTGAEAGPMQWITQAIGGGGLTYAAFVALGVQIALTQAVFYLTVVAAPLFLATLIYRPLSGLSTGFLNFMVYLGVKLFVLYLVAGVMGIFASEVLEAMLVSIVGGILGDLFGSDIGNLIGGTYGLTAASLFFTALVIFLPGRIAGTVSQRMNLDINGILFQNQLPLN